MRWVFPQVDAEIVSRLSHELNLPPLVARLLAMRGIDHPERASRFLQPRLEHLHDPYLMQDMDRAVARLRRAIDIKEKILIYGDYDVDGTMAAVILRTAIASLGGVVEVYIPHRVIDGYGMRAYAIEQAAREGCRVIVSVDTGIREHAVLDRARELGLDCIVTDHHLPAETLPQAFAILNPHRSGCGYPDKSLSGVGVAFKLAQALFGPKLPERGIRSYLKLVALGTIADVSPLTGENRTMAYYGLKGLTESALRQPEALSGRAGLAALLAVAGLHGKPISSGDVAFRLAPRLNAAGRMDSAQDVMALFASSTAAEVQAIAARLEALNRTRQSEEAEILNEIKKQIESQPETASQYSLIFHGDGWHRGVIGIVAQRVVELYRRPALVIALDGGSGHGSGRSIPGFHLLDALTRSSQLFDRFGGHAQAAGFALPVRNIARLADEFERHACALLAGQNLDPVLRVDARISCNDLPETIYDWLKRLEPFGLGNPAPVFASSVRVAGIPRVLKEKHLKMCVQGSGWLFQAVGWGLGGYAARLASGQNAEVAFTITENCFQGETSLRLVLKDIHLEDRGERRETRDDSRSAIRNRQSEE
jgi:single-stranded-DNA-specific exonuclease